MEARLLKIPVAIVTSVLAIALLASCGGDDSDATGAGSPDTAATTNSSSESATPAGDSTFVSPKIRSNVKIGPLLVTDQTPEQYRREVGDYTTLSHGQESTLPALEQVARLVHEYLTAYVRYDWATSCSFLGERALESVSRLGSRFKEVAGADCPTTLAFLLGKVPPGKTSASSEVNGGVFRVRREGGYFFYKGGKKVYSMSLDRDENGDWKINSYLVSEINPPPS